MNKTTKIIIGVAAALAVILLGIIFFLSKTVSDQKKANIDAQTQIEQLKLDYDTRFWLNTMHRKLELRS